MHDKNLNILRAKRPFEMKQKVFLSLLKGFFNEAINTTLFGR